MIDLFMEKMTAFWRWIWQKPLDAFLWMVGSMGTVFFAVLILVMFNDCVASWVQGVLNSMYKRDAIKVIGLGIAGVLAIFGAVAVSKRANAQIKNNKLTEIGHVQERFRAAVEHLGSKEESVRIASFYEFYHLALDDEGVRKNIFDILRANLRRITASDKYKKEIGFINGKKDIEDVKTTQEVRCLLDVLFRAKDKQKEFIFAEFSLNLQELFLVKANLHKANLQGAKMRGADLRGADLRKANLRATDLEDANLQGADLREANLQSAKLQEVELQKANLHKANLRSADLQQANLQEVILLCADLRGADLWGADLRKADLVGANLAGTNLRGADLQGADLQEVDFREVKSLERVNLSGAGIKGAMFPEGYEPPADAVYDVFF